MIYRYDQPIPAWAEIGGKAGAFANPAIRDLPVPPWFVITPDSGGDRSAPRMDAALASEIEAVARALAPWAEHFAVRSSALDEDGSEHSFAGQLDTFLAVRPGQLPAKVEAVWQSGFSERIRAYRREKGLQAAQTPAVIVQVMLDPEAAGVAFGADPVSGRRGRAVVSAVYGFGTALVSGEADADTFVVDQAGRILERKIAAKRTRHRVDETSPEGVAASAVDEAKVGAPALTDEQVAEVARLARITTRRFGRPQDIEWALCQRKVWLLQSRPITSIAHLADPDGELNLWDNANIAESYSGCTTPLTYSFARGIYEAVYRQFARLMGISRERIEQNNDLFPRMLGLIRGQIYYNLISWYRLLAMLPGFASNRAFMEQMMGVKEGLPPEVLERLAPAEKVSRFRDRLALAGTVTGLVWNHLTLPGQIRRFYHRLDQALRETDPALEDMRPDELASHYRQLERQLLLRWDAPLVNDFFAMIFYGLLRKGTAKWCGDADGTLQNDLLCGEGGMISAEPAKRVRELAAIASENKDFVRILCEGSTREIEQAMGAQPRFQSLYLAYLDRFGERCLEELKLESLTLHDEPLTLLRSIGQFARRGPAALGDPGTEARLRAAAETRVRNSPMGPPRRVLFGWILRNARERVRDRENLRFERTRLFGRVRRIFVELGKRLHAAGRLEAPRDGFYLTVEEILGFVEGTSASADLSGLVAVRKREFQSYRQTARPADRFATRGAVNLGNLFQSEQPAVVPTGESLKGIGCCPGVVRGPARVILDPRSAVISPGEILVAPRTDPGWIMLFPSAAGLLVEYGSLLSHSAIVAREMSIPAIVSIGGLTAWVKTGDWLEMDGASGIVRKMEGPA